jgi:hypothetical protein
MGLITFRIDKFFSTVPYDRMKRALSELSPVGGGEFGMARPLQELLLNTPHNPRIVIPQVKKLSVDREEGRSASAALDEWASRPPQVITSRPKLQTPITPKNTRAINLKNLQPKHPCPSNTIGQSTSFPRIPLNAQHWKPESWL